MMTASPEDVPKISGWMHSPALMAFDHAEGVSISVERTTTSKPAARNDLAAVKMGGPNAPRRATVAGFISVEEVPGALGQRVLARLAWVRGGPLG